MRELPQSGEVNLQVGVAPVSVQASRAQKDVVTGEIRAQTRSLEFLISGDVSVDVDWFIQEGERYETDRAPDVDNILKPIIDALCGPDGVLIDDCQVQSVSVHWLDSVDAESDKQEFHVRIKAHDPDAWRPKAGLMFAHLGKALCFPISGGMPPDAVRLVLDTVSRALDLRATLIRRGIPRSQAAFAMPIQRLFHKSRLRDFRVVDATDLLSGGASQGGGTGAGSTQ